jgi:hypothetical protein
MKKYQYEVGIGIQTVYLWPEANNEAEAMELAEEQFEKLSQDWEGFDLDYYADFCQIDCMTQEYKKVLNSTFSEPKTEEALAEAEISIACLMDEIDEITMEDLEHIQQQLIKIRRNK